MFLTEHHSIKQIIRTYKILRGVRTFKFWCMFKYLAINQYVKEYGVMHFMKSPSIWRLVLAATARCKWQWGCTCFHPLNVFREWECRWMWCRISVNKHQRARQGCSMITMGILLCGLLLILLFILSCIMFAHWRAILLSLVKDILAEWCYSLRRPFRVCILIVDCSLAIVCDPSLLVPFADCRTQCQPEFLVWQYKLTTTINQAILSLRQLSLSRI